LSYGRVNLTSSNNIRASEIYCQAY